MPVTVNAWKTTVIFGLVIAVIWVLGGGYLRGFSLNVVAFHAATGFFLGAIAAPELEPQGFRHPVFWQVALAVIGCVLFAASIEASPTGYAFAVVFGAALGSTARYWVKYANP